MSTEQNIRELVDQIKEQLQDDRRILHRHPEIGWTEYWTTSYIVKRLERLGYTQIYYGDQVTASEKLGLPDRIVQKDAYERALTEGADPTILEKLRGGNTGVIADLPCGESSKGGPIVALRFDIDALQITESCELSHRPFAEGFSSEHLNTMHACGHDGHTAVGLAVAEILMELRKSFQGTVRLIFQPAEEGCRGARAIVEKGWLDGVAFVTAAHVNPRREETDAVQIDPGSSEPIGSATTKYDVTFHGKSAHAGAGPQNGKNALVAASNAILNLYAIPRHSEGYTRINVGRLMAGDGRNIIPEEAFLEIETRGETDQLNQYMSKEAMRILEASAGLSGCEVEIRKVGEAMTIQSDQILREKIAAVCNKMGISYQPLEEKRHPWGAAEDFAIMAKRVQEQGGKAVYFNTLCDMPAPLHDSAMDLEEEALSAAVKVFVGLTATLLEK